MTPTITTPNKVQTTVTGLLVGEYKFGLKVTDAAGNSSTDSVSVNVAIRVVEDDVRRKTCGPLADIIKAFEVFDQRNRDDLFKRFLEIYPHSGQVREFFRALKNIDGSAHEKQVEFFITEFVNTGLLSQFVEWLQGLQNIIIELKELRGFAFELYRILEMLAIYIVCIQKEDFDVAKVQMDRIFSVIQEHASVWASMRANGDFGRVEAQLLLKMTNELGAALKQTEENKEKDSKSNYITRVQKIEAILKV